MMTKRAVPTPKQSHPTLIVEAFNLYIGRWRSQALIYGVTFITALIVALVADIKLGINPADVVLLSILFIIALLIVVPISYVAVARSLSSNLRSLNNVDKPGAVGDSHPLPHHPVPRRLSITGMDERIEAFHRRYVGEQGGAVPAHGLLYFDHLYAEYRSVKSIITNPESVKLLEEISARRWKSDQPLGWNDVYAFDLVLTKYLPLESLLRKAYELRGRYRSIVPLHEYIAYTATEPPDLATIGISQTKFTSTPATHPESPWPDEVIEGTLRKDVMYLMSRVYLEYALAPLREGMRAELTRKGVRWTLTFMILLVAFILISLVSAAIPEYRMVYTLTRISTLGVVVAAGIIGGLVSMLQRIQAAPSDADALHNINSLSNGWRGIFLAPLSGAIFASLLFVMFAGGILKGSIFPEIRVSATPAAGAPAATSTTTSEETSGTTAGQQNQPSTKPLEVPASPVGTAPQDGGAITSSSTKAMPFTSFLTDMGPASGTDFALLIVWSFVAGFAERLVPDALTRLSGQTNQSIKDEESDYLRKAGWT